MKYFSSLSHSLSRYTLLHPLPNSFPEAMIIKSLFCSPIQFSFFFSFPFRGSFSSRKENFHVVLFYYYYFFCGGGAAKFSFSLLFFIQTLPLKSFMQLIYPLGSELFIHQKTPFFSFFFLISQIFIVYFYFHFFLNLTRFSHLYLQDNKL